MKIIKSQLNKDVQELKNKYYSELIAPLDGMWESLFIAQSSIYLIVQDDINIAYICVNEEKSLVQFYVKQAYKYLSSAIVKELVKNETISSATLSSIEPVSFNACLEHAKSVKKDSINYQFEVTQKQNLKSDLTISLRLAVKADIESIQSFFKSEIGFDDTFGYTENLVFRKEIYLLEKDGQITATGECRMSETQTKIADIGMVVGQTFRKKGLGAKILSELVNIAKSKNRLAICSTTADNIPSQKAIENAGFYANHLIFKMTFFLTKGKKSMKSLSFRSYFTSYKFKTLLHFVYLAVQGANCCSFFIRE